MHTIGWTDFARAAALVVLLGVGVSLDARARTDGQMRLHCTGAGTVTVLVEAEPTLARLPHELAPHTRICTHAGGSGLPAQLAQDLDVLLRRSGESPPYLLAAHSQTTAPTLAYAHRYPTKVEGIVLLDAALPSNQPGRIADSLPADLGSRPLMVLSTSPRRALDEALTALSTSGLHLEVPHDSDLTKVASEGILEVVSVLRREMP
jgi:pimeloyl-ACP methyl ester carboxylesterase